MARLPDTFARRPVASGVRPIATIRNAGAVGAAVSDLGRGVANTGFALDRVRERERQEQAAAEAADGEVAFSTGVREMNYDPETGYLNASGFDAVQRRGKALAAIDELRESSLKGLSPDAAERLRPVLEARAEAAKRDIDVHASRERLVWLGGASAARVQNAREDALARFGSGEEVERFIGIGIGELQNKARREGMPIDGPEFQRERDEFVSGTLAGVILARSMTDPVGAMDYLEQNRGRLVAEDEIRLERALKTKAADYRGRQRGAAAYRAAVSYNPAESRITMATEGKVRDLPLSTGYLGTMDVILASLGPGIGATVVSGGQAPKGSGGPRTGSTRHDVDETGHANTADLVLTRNGEPVTPAEDPDLYARLFEAAAPYFPGMGHYEWGVHIGGGKPAFWGPDTHSASADPSFLAAYERGRSAGPAALMDIEDPDERDAAIAEFQKRAALDAAAEKARVEAARAAAFAFVDQGGSVADIRPEDRAMLGRVEVTALREYERKLASGEPVETDLATYHELNVQMATDPEGFAARNLLQVVDKLSRSDWQRFSDAQAKIIAGTPTSDVDRFAASTLMETSRRAIIAAGLDPNATDTTGAGRISAFQSYMVDWQERFIATEKHKPTPAEITAEANRALVAVAIDPPGLGNSVDGLAYEVDGFDVTPEGVMSGTLTIGGEDIPRAEIEAAAMAYVETFGRSPTVPELVDAIIELRGR